MFGDAYCKLNLNKQRKNRKPNELPIEDDLIKIRDYIKKIIADLSTKVFDIPDSKDYVQLRNVVCPRLTLFNARRGGEAARWLISEFKESE